MASRPVVEVVHPRAEKEDQVAEEMAREEEGGPCLCADQLDIAIPQHDRANLAHQQAREQRARRQDGEEIHQADEEYLRFE